MKQDLEKTLLEKIVIAIDGPAGSGKSTTARLVSKRLSLRHIDTGAMYRSVTLKAIESGSDLSNGEELGEIASKSRIYLSSGPGEESRVFIDGREVTGALREIEITSKVSAVSSHREVRRAMVKLQRKLASGGGVVLEGRDIGSVVLPSAHVKIYMDASFDARAKRRQKELLDQGIEKGLEDVRTEIEERDRSDASRSLSPLRKPVGAYHIDTSLLTIEEQVQAVISRVEETVRRLAELFPQRGERGDWTKVRLDYRLGQILIRRIFGALWGLRIVPMEKPNLKENYIFACNHLSYVDPPLVGSTLPREVHFMAKAELFKNRLLGSLISLYNAIPVRRDAFDRNAIETALGLLRKGRSILIFPEGTRQRGGGVGRPKSGAGYLAIHSGVPVVPIHISGSDRLFSRPLKRPKVTIVQGTPIRLNDKDTSDYKKGESYQAYSEMVMEAILSLKETL